jgi:hypothetical protein
MKALLTDPEIVNIWESQCFNEWSFVRTYIWSKNCREIPSVCKNEFSLSAAFKLLQDIIPRYSSVHKKKKNPLAGLHSVDCYAVNQYPVLIISPIFSQWLWFFFSSQRAFEALCHSTHLYGRRLVLEWAESIEDLDHLRKKTAQHFHNG